MALKNFNQAEKESGMLAEHMRAFQTVANRHDCVIACRHVGNTVTGLLRAGYATKSIAVHSKSCDWGPMAGFVCADARFTKKSYNRVNIREQRIEVKHQKVLAGTSIPIQINRRRIVELKQNWREWGMNSWIEINNEIVITASMAGKQYTFTIAGIKGQPDMYDISVDDGWSKSKVCAFTNPETVAGNYLNALTGDVDLWGVFPRLKVKQQSPNDHVRYAATAKLQEHNILHAAKKIKPAFNNSTAFVDNVINSLNAAILYPNGKLVQHGDELGRPKMSAPDLPFIAFFPHIYTQERGREPKDPPWIVDKGFELDEFYNELGKRGFYDEFNAGWKELRS